MKTKTIIISGILLFLSVNIQAQVSKVYGSFCSYSSSGYNSSSSYSSSEYVVFDGKGQYKYGSNSSYSGGGDGYYGDNGESYGTYKVQGDKVILTSTDGEVFVAYVNMVQSSGEITELKYGSTLFAKSLCD